MTEQGYGIDGRGAREIAGSIEAGIRAGRIPVGAKLPPVRMLAGGMGRSPGTIAAAYSLLRARGLIRGEGRRGTRVLPRPPIVARTATVVPPDARDLASGNPDPELLPPLEPALARLEAGRGLYGGRSALPELLDRAGEAFAEEGIPPGSLAVVGGALDGIERVLQAHLLPGDRVAVEDPGFPSVTDLVRALGLVPEPVGVDDTGPLPEDVDGALRAGAAAFILTSRAQNPTGAALDARRARQLRTVLDAHPEALVVEDDHAGPVAGAEALTTCHEERPRWVVVRSASKSLGPDIRLAVMAGDPETIARVEGRQRLGTGWVSHVLQRLVAELWKDPDVRALLDRAAHQYTVRREALVAALALRGIPSHGRSGLNVWIPVREEGEVARGLLEAGWAVSGGERFRLRTAPAIRVTVAALHPEEADSLASDLARVLRPDRRTRSA